MGGILTGAGRGVVEPAVVRKKRKIIIILSLGVFLLSHICINLIFVKIFHKNIVLFCTIKKSNLNIHIKKKINIS